MALLGDDERGYELARKLESHGVWRPWLGDSLYSNFIPFLSSPSSWETFMKADDSKTRAQIHLQLRARALLFDKASVSLFLRSHPSSVVISKLNPNYLQLHGDDLYFTLETSSQDVSSKLPPKSAVGLGSRYNESETDALSKRFKPEELPDTWYSQFFEKYRASKSYKLQIGDRETEKRTSEQMSTYLRVHERHKRRRIIFKEDQNSSNFAMSEDGSSVQSNSALHENNAVDSEMLFFPETMFTLNCIPDTAVQQIRRVECRQKIELKGILDTLPQIMTKSPIMIERLGIRPEYLKMEQGGNQGRGRNGSEGHSKFLGEDQASKMSQKVIAHLLTKMGFEAASESPLEVLAQFLSCHICKLGRILKLLTDSYRKQCSAFELLKMFLQTAGHSNLASLSELVKDNNRTIVQQTQQNVQGMQTQLHPDQQSSIRQSQQIPRQVHAQLQQMTNPQSLAFQQQQQLERMRRRQQSAPRPAMNMNMNMNTNTNMNMNMNMNMAMNMNMQKERPMVEVKLENPSDIAMDNNAFNSMSSRHPQFQFRQQQLAAMQSLHAQSGNQFRPMASLQIPQMQSPNTGLVRAPPVKVEGFQELMGGDSTMKHDSEENKLTSPPK